MPPALATGKPAMVVGPRIPRPPLTAPPGPPPVAAVPRMTALASVTAPLTMVGASILMPALLRALLIPAGDGRIGA